MLAFVVITTKHATPGLNKKLEECMIFFRSAAGKVTLEEIESRPWLHLLLHLQGQDADDCTQDISFRNILAECLAKHIVWEQAPSLFAEMMNRFYFYFPNDEKQQILTIADKSYKADPSKNTNGQIYAQAIQILQEYLAHNSYLNLEGIIRFRMQAWLTFLRKTLDKAVDDFLMEKEYQEFIKLLKYFVALQEPKIKQVHVLLDEDGRFCFLDHSYKPIEQQQDVMWESHDGTGDEEDQLVSMLITVAPHRIVLHKNVYTQYPKAVDTLKHVFENRVILCKQCKLCEDADKNMNLKGKT